MRRGIVVALCVGLVAGFVAGSALAGAKLNTTLTLENSTPSLYEGLLSSKRLACESNRRVGVFHDENDNGLDPSDYKIGSDTSNRKGEYEVQPGARRRHDHRAGQTEETERRRGLQRQDGRCDSAEGLGPNQPSASGIGPRADG
jgi:hypothetical protein